MIYELLLVQENGMCIPSDMFARRKYKRTGSVPYECRYIGCGLVFLSEEGCTQHLTRYHGSSMQSSHLYSQRSRPLLPEVSISLLKTCRIIRFEASTALYSRNVFHFSDPATIRKFRQATKYAQAGIIQDLGIKISSSDFNRDRPWLTYLSKFTHSLDFPHLRRMTIDLRMRSPLVSMEILCSMSERLGERSQGLEWVLVLTWYNDRQLDCFEPLVDRKDDSKNGKQAVQRHVWTSASGYLWKNALLWWGCPGEALPPKYRAVVLQQKSNERKNGALRGSTHLVINAS